MRLSIIIPIGGLDRKRNLDACLRCIKNQTFKDYEILIVEQSLDNHFYYKSYGNWIGIRDIENRGYNLSWSRNVGVKNVSGEIVVLMDCDLIFSDDYFEKINQMKDVFACGAEYYIWGSEIITERYFQIFDMNVFNENFHKLRSFGKIYGEGTCLCYNREWFLNIFGGYIESFTGWGCEDNEAAWRLRFLLKKTDEQIERIPINIIHLFHNHDISASIRNRELFDRIKNQNPIDICNKLKKVGIGKIDKPMLI